ncbi:MAG: alpha/beta fold hydrolase [Solirubrobacterales bacterium]|nr:alpha/beta fold hydrolase [Solirubrobacterales bacterium]
MADPPIPHLEGVEHRFVDAGGLRTHIAEAGEGPPVVMLHGWPQNWWMWRRLIGPLAASGRRVICPDLRGYGWTAAPPGGYEPEVFARDIAALIEAVSPGEPVDLVGHDWGGYTGFLLCLERPELVRRFLALNILHPFVRPSLNSFRHSWRFWYQWPLAAPAFAPRLLGGLAGRIEASLAWVGGPDARWDERDRAIFTEQFRDHDRAMGAALLYRHALVDILPGILRGRYLDRTLETETLLVFGYRDRVQHPSLVAGFEPNAPRMRAELVKASHFIVDSRPDLVLDRARELFGLR